MKINSNNYEIYFLDYIEGRLNPVESAELLIFVEQSPQLKVEFESLNELCTLTKTNEHCELHSLLKKNPNSLIPEINPVDEKLIDYLEGEPISENTFLFLNKLASIKKSFEQLKLTRLEPDNSIVFSDKGKLKKKTLIVSLQPALSIAAIFVFACITAAIVFFLNESNTDSTQISGNIAKVIPHFNKKETSLAAVTPIKNKVQKSVDLKQIQAYHKEVTPNFSDEVAISRTYEKTPMLESISLHTFDVRSTEKPEIISETRYEYTQLNEYLYARSQLNGSINDPYLTLTDVALKTLTGKQSSDYQQKGSFLWTIADAGISGINTIMGSSIQFKREAATNGTTRHFALGNLFEYSKK